MPSLTTSSSARMTAQPARGAFGTQAPARRALVVAASARPSPVHTPEQQPSTASQTSTSTRRELLTAVALTAAAAPVGLLRPAPAGAKGAAPVDPGDWSSPGLGAPVDPNAPKFVKLPSGVRYQELNIGSGPAASSGDVVLFDYVLRRSNGYFIYGTVEGISFQPRDVPTAPVNAKLGAGELIPGLEEVLAGMSPGSKRRALVPPELGYVGGGEGPQPPTFATKRQLETHRREPLLFEVQMLRVGGRK